MPSSGRLIGSILIVAGLALGAILAIWLMSGMREGTLEGSGAVFGFLFGFLILVAPLVGGGIFFLSRGTCRGHGERTRSAASAASSICS